MRTYLAAISLAVLLGCWVQGVQGAVPFTVDAMLRDEDISTAQFDPSGRYVVFQRRPPYEDGVRFWQTLEVQFFEHDGSLYVADLDESGAPQIFGAHSETSDYKFGSVSPDGRRVFYLRTTPQGSAPGVFDLRSRQAVDLRLASSSDGIVPLWVSATQMLFQATAPERLSINQPQQTSTAWQTMAQGRMPTASPVGSGRYVAKTADDAARALVLADTTDGSVRRLSSGSFVERLRSPDGRWLALLKTEPQRLDPNVPVEQLAFGHLQHQLILYDLAHDWATVTVCEKCDARRGSLRWSPDSITLAFVAREVGTAWDSAGLWRYDLQRRETQRVDLQGLLSGSGRKQDAVDLEFAWLGRDLAVRASLPPSVGKQDENRATSGWFLLQPGAAARNLTASFGAARLQAVGVTNDALLIQSGGEVWAVRANGRRRSLTAAVGEPLQPWRDRSMPRESATTRARSVIAFVTLPGRDNLAEGKLVFVDAVSGKLDIVAVPPAANILAVSTTSRRIVFLDQHEQAGVLIAAGADGSRRELARINEHLRDVVPAIPVRIDQGNPR